MKGIKILGGGLSGLTAAINLANEGYNVDVYEKRSDCGKRFKGDIEGLENWSKRKDVIKEIKSMNIKVNFDLFPFKKLHITDGKEILRNTLDNPIFYLLKRGTVENSLDQGLKKQALDLGVNIHFNSKIGIENMDIVSTGPTNKNYIGLAKGIKFETDFEDTAMLILNSKASNNGYSYFLVINGYGCICSVNCFSSPETANKKFKNALKICKDLLEFNIKNKKPVGGLGSFLLKPRYKVDNKIYTGEAAGFQDMLWGFGMRYAILSGYYASKSIVENKNYKNLIKENLSPYLKTSVVNRFITEKGRAYVYKAIFNIAKKQKDNWQEMLFQRYNPSRNSRLLYPFAKYSVNKRMRQYNDELKHSV